METIPLVESEEENAAQDQQGDNHKYLLFKNPSGMEQRQKFSGGVCIGEALEMEKGGDQKSYARDSTGYSLCRMDCSS
jgi:hypothetical protein